MMKSLSKDINKNLEKYSDEILKDNHKFNDPPEKSKAAIPAPVSYSMDDIVTEEDFTNAMLTYVSGDLEAIAAIEIKAAADLIDIDLTNLEFERHLKKVLQVSTDSIMTIEGTIKKDLQKKLLNGYIKDKKQIFEVASDYYGEFDQWKAKRIAQTTSTLNNSVAGVEVYKDAGIPYQWITERNDAVRPSHEKLDGIFVNKDGEFETVNEKGEKEFTPYPGGFDLASEDINCKCVIRPRPDTTGKHYDNILKIQEYDMKIDMKLAS